MDWRKIKSRWPSCQAQAAERWPELDMHALESVAGNRTELVAQLQIHYGLSVEEAGLEADRWADGLTGDPGGA